MKIEDIFCDLPTLATNRLWLRKLALSDTEDVFEYNSDPEVSRYMTWQAHHSLEETRNFVEKTIDLYRNRSLAPWGIVRKEDAKLIGTCGYTSWEVAHAKGEIAYVLSRHFWGQGYMTEALQETISFGFHRMALNRIEARVMMQNAASARLLERLGMTPEGVLRKQIFAKGVYHDMQIFSILREEWKS